jgi:glycosyltransferase involved in cell wall biosynthesis
MPVQTAPMHIVIDVRRVRDFGIGTYIRNLTHALSRLDQQNHYTLVVSPADLDQLQGLGPNFETAAFASSSRGFILNFQISQFLRSLHADLYHVPLNVVAWWMPRPYVVTIHDMSSLVFPDRNDIRSTLHQESYRRGAARAARVITVSNSTRRDIEAVLHVPPEKISTIYSAPDPAFTAERDDESHREQVLARYDIHHPFVLYAGAIRAQKNIPRLIEAFAVLRNDLENQPHLKELRLVIIGDELSRNPAVRRAVTHARIEQYVRFLGFVPKETLRIFYQAAQVFAFPSLYEGFGLAPLEAMSCGTPVVASNLPSLVEAVGDAAELVSPDNVFEIARGLKTVLLDPERRRWLIAAGRAQAAKFQWDATAREVLAIYREIARK